MLHKKFKVHGCSGFKELNHLNQLKCLGRRKLWMDRLTDGQAENQLPISHH